MDLHGGAPFWLARDGVVSCDDALPARADVVVIGAGITGALIADALVRAGFSLAVIDRRTLATGSTAASTALLLYQLDRELTDLVGTMGRADAERVYRRMSEALDTLDALVREIGPASCGYRRRASLYLASRQGHVRRLRGETERLRALGLDAAWLSAAELLTGQGIAGHGAILTHHAADVDPVALARALLARARTAGATISTGVTATALAGDDTGVTVVTDRGAIRARWCISAMGYETPPGITPPVVTLHSSYAFATEPLADAGPFAEGTMLWESNRPYLYARTTTDGRLLVGGADVPFSDPARRDALLHTRQAMLETQMRARFPALDLRAGMAWCGTFAETADGLPCIGPVPEMPRLLLALCAGGNGIPFGVVAAELLTAHCRGLPDRDAALFGVGR